MLNPLVPLTEEFSSLRQSLDRLVDDAFVGNPFHTLWSRLGDGVGRAMPLDVYSTDEAAVVIAAVPGGGPEEVDVTVHQNTITLSTEMANVAESEEAKGATWHLHELPFGTFRRSVTLPFELDASGAQAHCEHGILRIVVPRAEQAKPRKVAIVGGAPDAIGAGSPKEQSS